GDLIDALVAGEATVPATDGERARGMTLERHWSEAHGGHRLRAWLRNDGAAAVRVKDIVVCAARHSLPAETAYYGEGFQMLSQTAGTLGAPRSVGNYTDAGHYKIPQAAERLTAYGLATLTAPDGGEHLVIGFASCRRFVGEIRVGAEQIELVVDGEGLELAPGETWELEDVWLGVGAERDALLAELAAQLESAHPRLETVWAPPGKVAPTGWCSWYWFGPSLSEQDVIDNLRAIKERSAPLTFVQIDDGFQAAMGDWLIPGERFPSGVAPLCHRIHQEGFEPAIWLAPFIAEPESRVAREHPEWLVKDAYGQPLLSSEVSFGGWRRGPWYMLDGTHPGARRYIEDVCRTIHDEWGCAYFKLDALTWGALHGGFRHDPKATRIEAYRRGMEALLHGAGADSFILGCNAPLWGSLGLVHGMRVSNDVSRTWKRITQVAEECFWRGWQHGRLWVNDPDCVVLINRPGREQLGPGGERPRPATELTTDEFSFHATAVLATGGMVLSGDDLTRVPDDGWRTLERLVEGPGVPATFEDTRWELGRQTANGQTVLCALNWGDVPREVEVPLSAGVELTDYWTGDRVETASGSWRMTLPPHGGRAVTYHADPMEQAT
ncbi:MAG TPA: alpha-galactosidase, partial [Chloroflexota bacterium]|nr:alpha-galactosidase [Chloroflexota bacterium]